MSSSYKHTLLREAFLPQITAKGKFYPERLVRAHRFDKEDGTRWYLMSARFGYLAVDVIPGQRLVIKAQKKDRTTFASLSMVNDLRAPFRLWTPRKGVRTLFYALSCLYTIMQRLYSKTCGRDIEFYTWFMTEVLREESLLIFRNTRPNVRLYNPQLANIWLATVMPLSFELNVFTVPKKDTRLGRAMRGESVGEVTRVVFGVDSPLCRSTLKRILRHRLLNLKELEEVSRMKASPEEKLMLIELLTRVDYPNLVQVIPGIHPSIQKSLLLQGIGVVAKPTTPSLVPF